ncbi:C39 family peptidase [Sphaerotilaceae bacterium SBD11-9]
MPLPNELVPRLAGLELNSLRTSGVLGDEYEKLRIPKRGTAVHDPSGPVLFVRLPLVRGREGAGYVDIAVEEALGEPLLATGVGGPWDEKAILEAGIAAARKGRRGLKYDTVRFVAYSFPKIALQFLLKDTEVLMLELFSWAVVPPAKKRDRKPLEPENFERFSLLEELPAAEKRRRAAAYRKRLGAWDTAKFRRLDVSVVDAAKLRNLIAIKLVDQRELHYSTRNTDHVPCYELRGQQTNVWCVGASTEMLLNFYRYTYDQVRLAQELGLGTLANPNGLPYARVGDVVTVIENLSSNALDATMFTNPGFNIFRDEIRANRPLISFIPGHSRTVAGYTRSVLALPLGFRGLLVYDPWPPNAGVITRWENFATQTYQYAYSAVLRHV